MNDRERAALHTMRANELADELVASDDAMAEVMHRRIVVAVERALDQPMPASLPAGAVLSSELMSDRIKYPVAMFDPGTPTLMSFTPFDPEIEALRTIVDALARLEPAVRVRVADYIAERIGDRDSWAVS